MQWAESEPRTRHGGSRGWLGLVAEPAKRAQACSDLNAHNTLACATASVHTSWPVVPRQVLALGVHLHLGALVLV